jgi:hypothetical protein
VVKGGIVPLLFMRMIKPITYYAYDIGTENNDLMSSSILSLCPYCQSLRSAK